MRLNNPAELSSFTRKMLYSTVESLASPRFRGDGNFETGVSDAARKQKRRACQRLTSATDADTRAIGQLLNGLRTDLSSNHECRSGTVSDGLSAMKLATIPGLHPKVPGLVVFRTEHFTDVR